MTDKDKNASFLPFFAFRITDFCSVCHFAESLAELGFEKICAKSAFLPCIYTPCVI